MIGFSLWQRLRGALAEKKRALLKKLYGEASEKIAEAKDELINAISENRMQSAKSMGLARLSERNANIAKEDLDVTIEAQHNFMATELEYLRRLRNVS